jgi:hypothetical protein
MRPISRPAPARRRARQRLSRHDSRRIRVGAVGASSSTIIAVALRRPELQAGSFGHAMDRPRRVPYGHLDLVDAGRAKTARPRPRATRHHAAAGCGHRHVDLDAPPAAGQRHLSHR